MDSVSALARGDPKRRSISDVKDYIQHPARESATTVVIPDACCGGEAHAATVEVPVGENKPTTSLLPFRVNSSSGSNDRGSDGCLSVEDSGTANIAPLPACGDEIEDQAALIMAMEWHQEGWADGSFIGISSSSMDDSIDISPEDWLHVAENLTPLSAAELDNS